MGIDVTSEILVDRPRSEVADYVLDPANDPIWIGGISEAAIVGDGPVAPGVRVERIASFFGRRIGYTNEVQQLDPRRLLVMQSVAGPFPMRVSYEFEDADEGTLVRVRNEGEARGFFRVFGPLLGPLVNRSVSKDLRALKRILESPTSS